MGNPPSENLDFYHTLPAIRDFNAINELSAFVSAPDDWWVVIADVVNSTDAVNDGHYKQVNMVGASCITAVLNTLSEIEIPYVFGGDGATLLVPGQVKQEVIQALVNVRSLSSQQFGLQLRLGLVSVAELRQFNQDVLVAKYQVSPGNYLAMFSGGGTAYADKLIKRDIDCEQYCLANADSQHAPDLTGLSCRWQPLNSQNGQIICLLIQALSEDLSRRHQDLKHVLDQINHILGDNMDDCSPVNQRTLNFVWPPKGLKMEAQLTRGEQSVFRRWLYLLYQSFIQSILERFDLSAGGYNAPVYRQEITTNADFKRFDDTLRLVLDCSNAQTDAIIALLDAMHEDKLIAYGIHKTSQAQMTCLVFSLEQSEHIHFVDGGDGGFWAAAEQYKQQLLNQR